MSSSTFQELNVEPPSSDKEPAIKMFGYPKWWDMEGPRLERSVTLRFYGDWGMANLHGICGWLSMMMVDRTGKHSRYGIWNGRGGADAVRAVGRGEVDLALTTPAVSARAALDGRGIYDGESFPHIRALGQVPQWDRLVLAVDAKLGIRSFDEIRAQRPALVVTTSPDDGENLIGFAAAQVMSAAGIDRATLESWGGKYLMAERTNGCIDLIMNGSANAIIHEAIMTTWWQQLANEKDLAFISMEGSVLESMETKFGWPGTELPAGYFRGLDEPLPTLDFSDFLLVVRDDMAEDVAHLLAWCLCETRAAFEQKYHHIPPERSPVSYPLEPQKMAQTPIPLHRGARRYYEEAGISIEAESVSV